MHIKFSDCCLQEDERRTQDKIYDKDMWESFVGPVPKPSKLFLDFSIKTFLRLASQKLFSSDVTSELKGHIFWEYIDQRLKTKTPWN